MRVEKRPQPSLLLLRGSDPFEHLHVARVRCRAVEALRGERVLAQLSRNVRVVEVRKALARLVVGQEEVPEIVGFGFGLDAVEQLELSGRPRPAVCAVLAELKELEGDRLDLFPDEGLDLLEERLGTLRHPQIEHLVGVLETGHGTPLVSDASSTQASDTTALSSALASDST
jgi:hypothetical protein